MIELEGHALRDRLPMPKVWLHGRRAPWFLTAAIARGYYDFSDDVRELVLEPIRDDVYAEWSDPRERWLR
jgi:hypothetical protein